MSGELLHLIRNAEREAEKKVAKAKAEARKIIEDAQAEAKKSMSQNSIEEKRKQNFDLKKHQSEFKELDLEFHKQKD